MFVNSPPPGRAALRARSTSWPDDASWRGPPRLGRREQRARDRGGPQGRPAARGGRDQRRWSWASTWARSTWSCRSSRRARSRPACSASAGPATRSARRQPGDRLPQVPRRPGRGRGRGRAHAGRRDRGHALPPQPPRRARPADRGHVRAWTTGRSTTSRPWSGGRPRSPSCRAAPLDGVLDMLSGRYPSDEFAELRPRLIWDRVEGRLTGAARGPAPGRHLRRDDPRPGPLRGLPGRRERGHPGRRARRGDGVRDPGPARCSCSAPRPGAIEDITRDRVLVSPGARPAGQDAVLARRHAGAAGRAGPRPRRVHARAVRHGRPRPGPSGCAPAGLDELRRRQPGRLPGRAAGGHRGRCPTTAPSWSSASATSSATGASASSRPSGPRVHAPWALAIEARGPRAPRPRGPDHVHRRRDRGPAARGRRGTGRPSRSCSTPTRSRTWSWGRSATRRCSPAASASARPGRCCCPGAGPAGARRCGSSASAAPTLLQVAARYGVVPDPARDLPRVPPRRLRPARPRVELLASVASRARSAWSRSTPRAVAVRQLAAVRLRRRVHVRGRRAAGRAPGPGAVARPVAPGRAAGPRGAARAARPGRPGRPRAGAAAARPRAQGPRRRRPATTCCGRSAT